MYDIVFSDSAAKYIKENVPLKHQKLMLEKNKAMFGYISEDKIKTVQ